MITEDQFEQLAIQWFYYTGMENIEYRTPNIERRSEDERNLTRFSYPKCLDNCRRWERRNA